MGTGYQIDHFIAMACYGYSGWVTHPTTLCLSSRRNIFTKSKKMKLPAKSGTCFCRMRPKPSWAMTAWVSFLCNISLPRALPHYFRGQNFHIRGRSEGAGLIFHSGLLPRCVAQKQVQARTCTVCFRGASALWVFTSGHLTSNLRWNEYMEVLAVAQQGLSKPFAWKRKPQSHANPTKLMDGLTFFPTCQVRVSRFEWRRHSTVWRACQLSGVRRTRKLCQIIGHFICQMECKIECQNIIEYICQIRVECQITCQQKMSVSEYVSEMSRDICRSGITILAPE
jgi:hypothetical protein